MSLFGDMFNEEDLGLGSVSPSFNLGNVPNPPRASHGLCGIYNQGATCYLNSLIQSLMMTPEFRESLFQLDAVLGRLDDKDKPGAKVRVIPLQLQRLFSDLLLLDQLAASTTALTDSFGWTNSEELQQHDVQELNRILFSAIEDSLVGTSGQNLIQRLYHGQTVNQIICQECGRVSEREEDFMDLCVTVAGFESLEQALGESYVVMETMDGNNQYKCEKCQKLVDAKKVSLPNPLNSGVKSRIKMKLEQCRQAMLRLYGAKIRHLPDVLTVSLLRFSFDFQRMERYKETGKMTFPFDLDMAPFCENLSTCGDTEYELFSVVIHRGSTHGGHYHAYIRDVDDLGKWTHPDEEDIVMKADPSLGQVDLIEMESPQELVEALILQHGEPGIAVDKLCADMVKQTGVSWNKRFKKSYGPINKFLKKYSDIFMLDPETNLVHLCDYAATQKAHVVRSRHMARADKEQQEQVEQDPSKIRKKRRSPTPPPGAGQSWFDFDDSRVRPIRTKEIEGQFSGKESAYMLFYRRKSMRRTPEASNNPFFGIPPLLVERVLDQNEKLRTEREEYETKINRLELLIHFSSCYEYRDGALHPKPDALQFMELILDRRKTLEELWVEIRDLGGELVPEDPVLHISQDLPAGLHLYTCVNEDTTLPVMLTPIANQAHLFVWDGKMVDNMEIPVGKEWEPIKINFHVGNSSNISRGFPCCMTLKKMKVIVSNMTQIPMEDMVLSRVHVDGTESSVIKMSAGQEDLTLTELKVKNGDNFIVDNGTEPRSPSSETKPDICDKLVTFVVQNRCDNPVDGCWKLIPISVERDVTVGEVKAHILSHLGLPEVYEGGRLRLEDDDIGVRPPLHEGQSLATAGLKGNQRLIIEPGPAPLSNQLTLSFNVEGGDVNLEVMLEGSATIEQCLVAMLTTAGIPGRGYHLCKTNWCGEAGPVLDDLQVTLLDCQLRDGEHLLLRPGELPPKGFLKLPIYLSVCCDDSGALDVALQGISLSDITGDPTSHPVNIQPLGEVVISKKATLEELCQQILTLSLMETVAVASTQFLRVRVLESGRPTTVLRGQTQILQRLKVVAGMKLVVQMLQEEEDLNSNQILLNLRRRVVETRTYFPPEEFIWDHSTGCSASNLKSAIARHMDMPMSQLVIAKHFPKRFAWMVLEDGPKKPAKHAKGKKKGQNKSSLKQAPYHVSDGDDIAVKDTTYDPLGNDDLCTVEDDLGQEKLLKEIEDKKRQREVLRQQNAALGYGSGDASKRRPEVGIKIHVGDFR